MRRAGGRARCPPSGLAAPRRCWTSVTLIVKLPKGSAVTVARASASSGLNKLAWNRKLHGKRAGRGSYRLTATATFQRRKTSSRLTVRLR